MTKLIEEYLNQLEAKRTSRTVINRTTKIKRATSQMSTATARAKNDSLYKQMKKFCDKCKEYREKIHKKYNARNRSRARR